MRVDVHTHILPRTWPDFAKRSGYDGWVRLEHPEGARCGRMMKGDRFFRDIDPNCWDADVRMDECDQAKVDVQVLSTVPVMFSYWAQPRDTLDLARFLNDDLAATCHKHPLRFCGLGTLPMQDPDLAIPELERCMTELGLKGIEIGTHIGDWNLDEPALFPVLERAAQLGAVVFIHPWDMMGMKQLPNYFLPWLVSMPAETSRAICSLIFGGVLDRLPDLKPLFAHGGGSFPATIGRIDRGFDCRPDLCQVHTQSRPSSYLRRLYLDSLVHDPVMLQHLVDRFGADRIALGTDYPFPLGEAIPGRLIETTETLTDEQRAMVLGGTAASLFGLDGGART